MRTNELEGAALDWAVAKCEGHDAHVYGGVVRTTMRERFGPECRYSTDWAQGGPIIEREGVELFRNNEKNYWFTSASRGPIGTGPTPLIAAMRCHVATKLGDEIEIPEELNNC